MSAARAQSIGMTEAGPSLAEEVDRLIARIPRGFGGRTRWQLADAVGVFSGASEVAWTPDQQLEVLSQLGRYMGQLSGELQKSVLPSSHWTIHEAESPALAALLCVDEDDLSLDPRWVAKAWRDRAVDLIVLTEVARAKLLPEDALQAGLKLGWTAHLRAMELYQRNLALDFS
jgi:hypothetical protein